MCPSVKSYLSRLSNEYVVSPFVNVFESIFVPSLNKLIVISGCFVPSGSTHVFVPSTFTVESCSILFVTSYPLIFDVYPFTVSSDIVYS